MADRLLLANGTDLLLLAGGTDHLLLAIQSTPSDTVAGTARVYVTREQIASATVAALGHATVHSSGG